MGPVSPHSDPSVPRMLTGDVQELRLPLLLREGRREAFPRLCENTVCACVASGRTVREILTL